MLKNVTYTALADFPLVKKGDNISALIYHGVSTADISINNNTVFVITQKIISKSEGRFIKLDSVTPGKKAIELSEKCRKDPRLIEIILRESNEVCKVREGLLITEHRSGIVCANAGVDQSNVGNDSDCVLLLPEDPDKSAAEIRKKLEELFQIEVGVVISDTQGRAFRNGVIGVAIGCSGVPAQQNLTGKPDIFGRELQSTILATADEIAAGASLLMGQADEKSPVIIIQGLSFPHSNGSAATLIRPKEFDLFRQ